MGAFFGTGAGARLSDAFFEGASILGGRLVCCDVAAGAWRAFGWFFCSRGCVVTVRRSRRSVAKWSFECMNGHRSIVGHPRPAGHGGAAGFSPRKHMTCHFGWIRWQSRPRRQRRPSQQNCREIARGCDGSAVRFGRAGLGGFVLVGRWGTGRAVPVDGWGRAAATKERAAVGARGVDGLLADSGSAVVGAASVVMAAGVMGRRTGRVCGAWRWGSVCGV